MWKKHFGAGRCCGSMNVEMRFIRCVKREHANNVITMILQCFESFSYPKIKTSPFKKKNIYIFDDKKKCCCNVVVLAGRIAVLFYCDLEINFYSAVLFDS